MAGRRRAKIMPAHPHEVAASVAGSAEEVPAAEAELRRQHRALLETQRALDAERQRYLELFDFAPEPYVITDVSGSLREVNRVAGEMLGVAAWQVAGKPLVSFIAFEDRPAFRSLIEEALAAGRVADRRLRLHVPDGEVRHIGVTVATLGGAPPSGLGWLLRDVNARVRYEGDLERRAGELDQRVAERTAELERALVARDEFLGMISHELKTPITTIAGNAEVLRRRGAGLSAEAQIEAISDIELEANRLKNLLDDLLVLARAEAGSKPAREPIMPGHVVTNVAAYCERTLGRRINVRVPERVPAVLGEETYLGQVLRNLIGNAAKYSPPDTPIDVELAAETARIVLRVCDRGQGIPAGEMQKIFDPFYRSDATSRTIQGAGIGLAVCRRLVEAQGGEMWVQARDGGGTEFAFSLPISDP